MRTALCALIILTLAGGHVQTASAQKQAAPAPTGVRTENAAQGLSEHDIALGKIMLRFTKRVAEHRKWMTMRAVFEQDGNQGAAQRASAREHDAFLAMFDVLPELMSQWDLEHPGASSAIRKRVQEQWGDLTSTLFDKE